MSTSAFAIKSETLTAASEQLQRAHYNRIAADYDAHYGDAYSAEYRSEFIYRPMFEGIELKGLNVLDAMCGSGQTTEFLLNAEAKVTGLDISNEVITSFAARWNGCKSVERSLLDSRLPSESFDCVAVVGGLHHIQPNVAEAITEVHRLLKPGGYFCFMEPHQGSFPDLIRRFWYKHDHYFSDNEEAINLAHLEDLFESKFTFRKTEYKGNLAFLFVLNSLIFRIPLRLKQFYSSTLIQLESSINRLQGKQTSCFVVAQWQRK